MLSSTLLKGDELMPITAVKPNDMIDCFLLDVSTASSMAKRQHAPLLALVFCHGSSFFELLFDNGNPTKGLTCS